VANEAAVWALVAEQAGRVGGDDACRSAAALAEQCCRRALAELQALGMSGAIVDVNGTLACALALAGRHDEACSLFDSLRDHPGLAWVNAAPCLVASLQATGRGAEVRALLDQALARAEQLKAQNTVERLHRALHDLHKSEGRSAEALHHHERLLQLYEHRHAQRTERRAALLAARVQQHELHALLGEERRRAQALEADARHWQHTAMLDALTGLANRRQIDQRLPALHGLARAQGRPLPLALIDLDHFKRINDEISHAAGDVVIRRVAAMLQQVCRDDDFCARWGGDELLLLLPGATLDVAAAVCERLRLAMERETWKELPAPIRPTLSIGLVDAAVWPDDASAMAAADAALAAAKQAGRNTLYVRSVAEA
jgi:diguanylate cyclase (GGDEF)-like protein